MVTSCVGQVLSAYAAYGTKFLWVLSRHPISLLIAPVGCQFGLLLHVGRALLFPPERFAEYNEGKQRYKQPTKQGDYTLKSDPVVRYGVGSSSCICHCEYCAGQDIQG